MTADADSSRSSRTDRGGVRGKLPPAPGAADEAAGGQASSGRARNLVRAAVNSAAQGQSAGRWSVTASVDDAVARQFVPGWVSVLGDLLGQAARRRAA